MASKKQRQRQLARNAYERRLERRAEQERRAKQWAAGGIVAVLVVGIGIGAAALAGAFSSPKPRPVANASPTTSATPSASPSASPTPTAALVDGKCVYTPSGTAAKTVSLPQTVPDTKATYQATIHTNRGDIVIDLANADAPCTVNSFVSLAEQKYFNATHCHRVTSTDPFVLQCGDPTGTGQGGPGYEFYTENLTAIAKTANSQGEATYPAGTVAMARNVNSQDTNGSQFFLVYKNSPLSPTYTPFGTIVSGLNILQNVAKAGSDNSNGQGDGHPKESVDISSVTIKKT